jgi:hypothetical protein
MIKAKAFRTFIRVYAPFSSERLSTNIKLTLHKALIRSVITQACSVWEFVTDTLPIKLQCSTGNFPWPTPIREMQIGFHLPYVHDYMRKLCMQEAEVILNYDNENVRYIAQGEVRNRK